MTCSLCLKKYRLKPGSTVRVTVRVTLDPDTIYAKVDTATSADICPTCYDEILVKVEAAHERTLAEAATVDPPPPPTTPPAASVAVATQEPPATKPPRKKRR